MTGHEGIAVLLPARNEQEGICDVIADIRAVPLPVRIIVVDSGSTDDTRWVVEGKGVEVLRCLKGKGRAMRQAFLSVEADYVFMMDADCTYPAQFIVPMLEELCHGTCDAIVGVRPLHRRSLAMPQLNRIGNIILTRVAELLFGIPVGDVCSGLWGFRGDIPASLDLNADGFTLEADIYTSLALGGYRIGTWGISYRERKGRAKLRISDGGRILLTLLRKRLTHGAWRSCPAGQGMPAGWEGPHPAPVAGFDSRKGNAALTSRPSPGPTREIVRASDGGANRIAESRVARLRPEHPG